MRNTRNFRPRSKNKAKFLKTPEFKAALYASLIAFAISPISQLISYYLSEHWSRPILSIEYVFVNKISEIQNLNSIESYFLKSASYEKYLSKNFITRKLNFQTIGRDMKGFSHSELLAEIKNEFDNFSLYLNEEKLSIEKKTAQIDKMSLSEVKISFLLNSDNAENELPYSSMKIDLKKNFILKIREIEQAIADVKKIKDNIKLSTVAFQLRLSVLNKGSNDGLIRNEGTILFNDTLYAITRIPPPTSSDILNAVPTYNINSSMDFSSNSVGRIEKKTMADFWFQVNKNGSLDFDLSKKMKIILKDHSNNEISKFNSRK